MNKKDNRIKKKSFRFLWVTNSWDSLDHLKDTTLRLMEESSLLGHENYWCDVKSISLDSTIKNGSLPSHVYLSAKKTTPTGLCSTLKDYSPSFFNSIQYRVDPPIDHAYTHPLQLLTLGIKNVNHTKIVNSPKVLVLENEKFSADLFKNLFPPSLVSSQLETLLDFGKKERKAVLKPLYLAQSKGIKLLSFQPKAELKKTSAILKQSTRNFSQPVILQRYLPSIRTGEVRMWFLDGDLLAHIKKIPKQGEFRINMDQGGILRHSHLSRKEKAAIPILSKNLNALGVRLAAVDLIDGYVTDFNFTSPGLLPQMEKILEINLSKKIINALASR